MGVACGLLPLNQPGSRLSEIDGLEGFRLRRIVRWPQRHRNTGFTEYFLI